MGLYAETMLPEMILSHEAPPARQLNSLLRTEFAVAIGEKHSLSMNAMPPDAVQASGDHSRNYEVRAPVTEMDDKCCSKMRL